MLCIVLVGFCFVLVVFVVWLSDYEKTVSLQCCSLRVMLVQNMFPNSVVGSCVSVVFFF